MTSGLIAIAAAIAISLPAMASAIAQGITAARAMEGIARQPEASKNISSSLIISLAFMEALTIFGMLIAIMIMGKM